MQKPQSFSFMRTDTKKSSGKSKPWRPEKSGLQRLGQENPVFQNHFFLPEKSHFQKRPFPWAFSFSTRRKNHSEKFGKQQEKWKIRNIQENQINRILQNANFHVSAAALGPGRSNSEKSHIEKRAFLCGKIAYSKTQIFRKKRISKNASKYKGKSDIAKRYINSRKNQSRYRKNSYSKTEKK